VPRERIRLDARCHGVVLIRPFIRAFALAAVGAVFLTLPWPVPLLGPLLVGAGAAIALSAVWRWDRTRLVVTTDKIVLVRGVARKHASGVRLARVQAVEVEQSLLGRLLGYGTVIAGALRVDYVPEPHEVAQLLG
jgi:membrane protein YdbS with pleckstrin-like domain